MPREDKEDRDQRIDKEKDKKNLITENNEYGKNADETVLSENVIDVYDIISHSTDPNIIKLRKLIEYGINEEMIVKIYEGQSSNVENKESAIDILSKMYEDLVKYINKMPNGIVINPNTGEKDDDASRKQAAQVGIADELEHDRFQQIGEQYFIEKINKQFTNQTGEKEVLKTAIRFDKKVFDKDKFSFDKEFEDFIRKRQKEYKQQVIENVISTTLDDVQALIDSSINISEIALKERIKFAGPMLLALLKGDRHKGEPGRATDLIKKLYPDLDGEGDNTLLANLASIVLNKEIDEKDPMKIVDAVEEIEKLELKKVDREASKRLDIDDKVLSMEARLAITDKSTPEYEILLKEIKNFYKQNPECIEFADSLKDENGNLTIEAQSKVSKYINDLRDSIINSKIEKFEKCDKSKLTDEEKKHFTSIFLVGAGTESNKDLSTKSQEILLEMYPEMKTNSKEDLLKNIVGMVLENDPKSPNNDYKEKIASMTQVLNQVLVTEDSQRMQKVSEKHIDEFYEKESVQLAVSYDITKSIVQNTFNESNINFTKQDEESFNNLYKECSVNTWIGKKEDIIYHRYMALLDVQEKIDSNPPGTMMDKSNEKTIKRMLAQIREKPEIQAFEEKLSTYTPEELAEYKKSEAEFRKAKMEAKVLDVFSKKVIHHDVNYHDMTTGGKQEYLKIIIYARELAEASTDPKEKDMLMKLSNRGLELMNTEEKKFITFDENGNPNIDEGLLIDEYKSRISTWDFYISVI